MQNLINYYFSEELDGYVISIPDNLKGKTLRNMLYDLRFNILNNERILLIGDISVIKNHCKFYKRLGNRVIYEGFIR